MIVILVSFIVMVGIVGFWFLHGSLGGISNSCRPSIPPPSFKKD